MLGAAVAAPSPWLSPREVDGPSEVDGEVPEVAPDVDDPGVTVETADVADGTDSSDTEASPGLGVWADAVSVGSGLGRGWP